jgi:hypothetical protein
MARGEERNSVEGKEHAHPWDELQQRERELQCHGE